MSSRDALRIPLLVLAGVVAACGAALTPHGEAVQVSDENMVTHCQYLGDVMGNSETVYEARNDARNDAASLRATNIVFVSQDRAASISEVTGRAYRCSGRRPSASAAQ